MANKRESPNAPPIVEAPAYIYFGDDKNGQGIAKAMSGLDSAVDEYSSRTISSNRFREDTRNIGGPGVSGRHGMTNQDYENWRPNEASTFKNAKAAIDYADKCYASHGLIKHVIDLMADFTSQGIRIVHPNKKIQRFHQNFFRKVQGPQVSERFSNYLYRLSNVVVKSQTARVNKKNREDMFKTIANPDLKFNNGEVEVNKSEIPIKYTFLHPSMVDVAGGALSNFIGRPQYNISVNRHLEKVIKNPRTEVEKALVSKLPADILNAVKSSKQIPLDSNKTFVYHYKKDDWQSWAYPIISSIAIDISLYEKLKLADRAALDGAISNIRIFKIGSLEHKIMPTDKAATKLASILESNTEAGTIDLIWGPDIELIESKTSVHQFLGQSKYEPTLMAIYAGLGIPSTLTGTGGGGTTNNFISLKTMTQRLEYGRDVLTAFWNEQLKIIQKAMGFKYPARVEYDIINLGDEVAEKALLLQLIDRGLMSDELLQMYFRHDPEMESIRINAENKERERGVRQKKAGPFFDGEFENTLKKILTQTGTLTPSQLGIELKDKKEGEKPALEMRQPAQTTNSPTSNKKKGEPQQGRPKNSTDKEKRKTKTFKPKVRALHIWASSAYDILSAKLNPIFLENYGVGNLRGLTKAQISEMDKVKLSTLCHLEPFVELNDDVIQSALSKKHQSGVLSSYKLLYSQVTSELNRELSFQERKELQSQFYVLLNDKEE